MFAIFDGHGGSFVANALLEIIPTKLTQLLKQNLPHKIKSKKERNATVKKILIQLFLEADKEVNPCFFFVFELLLETLYFVFEKTGF